MHAIRALAAALAAAAILAGALALARAGDPDPPAPPAPTSRLVSLYAGDPEAHSLDLADGTFGARVTGRRLVEGTAHVDYGNYADDALTFALDEEDRGIVVDLGHWADLAKAYDYPEADGGGVGFASLSFEDPDFRIARRLPKDGFQNLREGRALLATVAGERRVSVHPVPGHVYLVRIVDRHRRNPVVHAKILVVSHVPGDHVTFRWDRVPGL